MKCSDAIAVIERETGQSNLSPETRLDTLDLDSLEFYELLLVIERDLNISAEESVKFETIGDFCK